MFCRYGSSRTRRRHLRQATLLATFLLPLCAGLTQANERDASKEPSLGGHEPIAGADSYSDTRIGTGTSIPEVSSLTVFPSGEEPTSIFRLGELLKVKVSFDQRVLVEEGDTLPSLAIRLNGEVRQAIYAEGSGTDSLIFTYRVESTDEDPDGIEIETDSIRQNLSAVLSLSGINANLSHDSVHSNLRYRVDGKVARYSESLAQVIDQRSIGIHFDDSLDVDSVPPQESLRVYGSESFYEIRDIQILDRQILVTVEPASLDTESLLTIEYAVPSDDRLVWRDLAGNAVEAFSLPVAPSEALLKSNQRSYSKSVGTDIRDYDRIKKTVVRELIEKRSRTPVENKISSNLRSVLEERPVGAVEIDIHGVVEPSLTQMINSRGGFVVASHPDYGAIRATVPLSAVRQIAALTSVTSIRTAELAYTNQSTAKENTSEGVTAHQVDLVHELYGYRGTGIGVGVISDGVNTLAERQATGDLPSNVTVLEGQAGDGDEGTAMLELVHDLAPKADLYFAAGLRVGQAQFAKNVEALCDAGADIIVDDIIFYREPAFQDGLVSRAINTVVSDGCIYFSAAGNNGNKEMESDLQVWEGDFEQGEELFHDGEVLGYMHVFDSRDSDPHANVASSSAWFSLQWADAWGDSENDYDLFVFDEDDELIKSSTDVQSSSIAQSEPFEIINSRPGRLVVVRNHDAANRYLRLHAINGRLVHGTLGATWGHNAAENAITVGAVDPVGEKFRGDELIEDYSSDGPRRIFFEADGTPITAEDFSSSGGRLLEKPEITASACMKTASPGFSTFCGTSAAAPHAAAIGALVADAVGGIENLDRASLVAAMRATAIDIHANGTDPSSGSGFVMAPGTVAHVATVTNHPPEVVQVIPDYEYEIGGTPISIDLSTAFSDPDNDELSFTVWGTVTHIGSSIDTETSTWTLAPTVAGIHRIGITASDSSGLSTIQAIVLSVSAGSQDYDVDDDGLIEVRTLEQLSAIRYDLAGSGILDRPWDQPLYQEAFNGYVHGMGCPESGCIGYELVEDIDFDTNGDGVIGPGDKYWEERWNLRNDSHGWQSIGAIREFNAIFEGNGHKISNLWMDVEDEKLTQFKYHGLFGAVGDEGVIRNVGLENVDIKLSLGVGQPIQRRDYQVYFVGAFAGRLKGRIEGAYATGSIQSVDMEPQEDDFEQPWIPRRLYLGGFVGLSWGTIDSSFAAIDVQRKSSRNLNADTAYVGGAAGGQNYEATLKNFHYRGTTSWVNDSDATSTTVGEQADVGALIGLNTRSHVANSYAVALVKGGDTSGVVGSQHPNSTLTQSYIDLSVASLTGHIEGVGQSTAALTQAGSSGSSQIYSGWSRSVWDFGESDQYPALKYDFNRNGATSWTEFGYQFRDEIDLTLSKSGERGVSLSWTGPLRYWNPVPTTSYSVMRKALGDSTLEPIALDVSGTSYTDEVPALKAYEYLVQAKHEGSTVAYSRRAVINTESGSTASSSSLSSLIFSGLDFPSFSSDQTEYELRAAFDVSSTIVTAVPALDSAEVTIVAGTTEHVGRQRAIELNTAGGESTVVTITVAAAGSETNYRVVIFREPAPPLEITLTTRESLPTSTSTLTIDLGYSQPVADEELLKMYFQESVTNGRVFFYTTYWYAVLVDDDVEGEVEMSLPAAVIESVYGAMNTAAAASFAVDRKGPQLIAATVSQTSISLRFHEELDTSSIPPASAFALGGTDPPTVDSVALGADSMSVVLSLDAAAEDASELTLSYVAPSTDFISDVLGNPAADITGQALETGPSLLLDSLTLTGVSFDSFSRDVTDYTVSADYGLESTVVEATPVDATVHVSITDSAGSTDGTQRTVNLRRGTNQINIAVTDDANSRQRTYQVTVNRSTVAVDYDLDDDGLIEIENLAQLNAVRYDLDGDGTADNVSNQDWYSAPFPSFAEGMGCPPSGCTGYELLNDVDFADTQGQDDDVSNPHWNYGQVWLPIGESNDASIDDAPFSAVFDGRGYTIKNLSIVDDREVLTQGGGGIGLFSKTTAASVLTRLALERVDIRSNHGSSVAGGLVGIHHGRIENSYVTGHVYAESIGGGLVGKLVGGTISQSRSSARVGAQVAAGWSPSFGGLVGHVAGGRIENSYSTGSIQGRLNTPNESSTGGIFGKSGTESVTVLNSYATGPQHGDHRHGIGPSSSAVTTTDSYCDSDTVDVENEDVSIRKTTNQLQEPTGSTGIYANWDSSVWDFGNSTQYPALIVDFDNSGHSSWQEFGYQIRNRPRLNASADGPSVSLAWSRVRNGFWPVVPDMKFHVFQREISESGASNWVEIVSDLSEPIHHLDMDEEGTLEFKVCAVANANDATYSEGAKVTIDLDESNATLADLTLSRVDIGTFSGSAFAYSANVPYGVNETVVGATTDDKRATFVIADGEGSTNNEPRTVGLTVGENVITTTVTAADGQTTQAYQVTVNRDTRLSTDATLGSLTLSGVDIGTFDATVATYSGTVSHSQSSTNVTATPNDDGASVEIEDVNGVTEGTQRTVDLTEGTNTITVTVTAEDAETELVYTISVTRLKPLPQVTIQPVQSSVEEGDDAEFKAYLSLTPDTALTVALSTQKTGSAVEGTLSSVTFEVGESEKSLSLSTDDDDVVEASSSVTIELQSGSGYTVGNPSSATVTVSDNDVATFSVTANPVTVDEGDESTVTVTIANPVVFEDPQSIDLTTSGTASSSDYTLSPRSLTLPAGQSSVNSVITVIDDTNEESDETITVHAAHNGSSIGNTTVTINANDEAVEEDSDDATLASLSLSGIDIGTFSSGDTTYSANVPNSVDATTVTAIANHDAASVEIADADGSTTGTTREVSLTVGENTITVTVTAEDAETEKVYIVTVNRAESLPVVTVDAVDESVPEASSAVFKFSLNKAAHTDMSVNLAVDKVGDAVPGTVSEISVETGEDEKTLWLGADDDSVVEDDTRVTVSIETGAGYTVGSPSSATVMVLDNDVANFAVTLNPTSLDEGNQSTLTISITNSVTFAENQTIGLSSSGTVAAADFTLSADSLTLAAGSASVNATVTATDDDVEEDAETLTITANHDGSDIGSATLSINANDAGGEEASDDATLSALSLTGVNIGTFSGDDTEYSGDVESNVSSTVVTATASHASAKVEISDAEGSTEDGPRTVNLEVGENTINVTVTAEDGETTKAYTVVVTRAELPVVTIVNDGPSTVTEGEFHWYIVALDRDPPADSPEYRVYVDVDDPGDETLTESIAARFDGRTSKFGLASDDDSVVEGANVVTLTLSPRDYYEIGTPSSAAATIEDNDTATFSVSANPTSVDEGESSTLTVAIDNSTTFAEDQTILLAPSGSAATSDYTLSATSLTLAAGATSTTATMTATDDEDQEDDETVTVTARHEGVEIGSAVVTIIANDQPTLSDDATLSALSLTGVDIGTFSGDDTEYSGDVESNVSSTVVTATASHASAKVEISDAEGSTEDGPRTVNLEVGENTINVTVTAEDGETTKAYTVVVTRAELPVVTIVNDGPSTVTEGEFHWYIVALDRDPPADSPEYRVYVDVDDPGDETLTESIAARFDGRTSKFGLASDDDSVVEGANVVTLTLSPRDYYEIGTPSSAAATIEDNDTATFSVSANPTSVDEGESSTLTVAIDNSTTFAEDQTILLAPSGSAATSDYTLSATSLTLAAGATSTTATLTATDDSVQEDDETVTVTARHEGVEIGSAVVTINANDQPTLSDDATLSALSLTGVDIGTFSSDDTSYTGSVANDVTSTTVTATSSDDGASTVIADTSGSTEGTTRTVSLVEGSNTITVTVTAEDETTEKVYTVIVTRAMNLPIVTISTTSGSTVTEGDDIPVKLTLNQDAASAINVAIKRVITTENSVSTDTYQHTIASGSATKDFDITTYNDNFIEADKALTVSIEPGTGYVAGSPSSLDFTVESDDSAEFSVTADPIKLEESQESTITVSITNGNVFLSAQTISFTVSGDVTRRDYRLRPSPATLGAKQGSTTTVFKARNDDEDEEPETATVTASHDNTSIGTVSITIGPEIVVNDDATLASLTASNVDFGVFSSGTLSYEGEAVKTLESTLVKAKASNFGARIRITDENGRSGNGQRDVSLSHGVNEVKIRVTATDETTRKFYTLEINRVASNWGDHDLDNDIDLADVTKPNGLWSDDEIIWVANNDPDMIYAFKLTDGSRNSNRDITPTGVTSPSGIWSDGTTIWVGDWFGGVLAFKLADGTRDSDKDLDKDTMTVAGNDKATGLWSDGDNMWVADSEDNWVYVYDLDDGSRQTDHEIDMTDPGPQQPSVAPFGLWSTDDFIFTGFWWNSSVRAHRLSDGKHHPPRNFDVAGAGVSNPTGLWSDGTTMWVIPANGAKLYAFEVPGLEDDEESSESVAVVHSETDETVVATPARVDLVHIEDRVLRSSIEQILGKLPYESIDTVEMATIVALDLGGLAVESLEGLEYAVSLRALDIGSTHIHDFGPLDSMSGLLVLNLDNLQPIYHAIGNLRTLRRLSMRNNKLNGVSVLSQLTELEALDIGGNEVVDIGPLSYLEKLVDLRVDNNRILDVSALVGLEHLVNLDASQNRIEDASSVFSLRKLKHLNLEGNRLSQLGSLLQSSSLETLKVRSNPIESHEFLDGFPSLRYFDLRDRPPIER